MMMMNSGGGGDCEPRTLYVGNLDAQVTEDFLCTLFGQMGSIKSCKIIREPGNDPYAFIEFMTHQAASTALTAMNKRIFLEKEMKVNWATSPGNQPKADTSAHHHIFVGDLSPEIDQETLREAFAPFGEISNCRIVKDPQTLKSRGYAFVSFVKKSEAENAIQAMNGQWLGSRSIRTNWSTRKPPPPREGLIRGLKGGEKVTYDDIYNQSSPTNMTVYFGGLPPNTISEYLVQKQFASFGTIEDVRVFKDKGFAFIKFTTKEAAAHAIEATHNAEVMGKPVKCFWGKENGGEMGGGGGGGGGVGMGLGGGLSLGGMGGAAGMIVGQMAGGLGGGAAAAAASLVSQQAHTQQQQQHGATVQQVPPQGAQYPYSYQQMGYWYQPGYPAAQMPYMQQGYYPYAYTSPQQAGAGEMFSAYRMVQPATAMYVGGVPGSAAANGAAAAAAAQQSIVYTTLPQYQTQ